MTEKIAVQVNQSDYSGKSNAKTMMPKPIEIKKITSIKGFGVSSQSRIPLMPFKARKETQQIRSSKQPQGNKSPSKLSTNKQPPFYCVERSKGSKVLQSHILLKPPTRLSSRHEPDKRGSGDEGLTNRSILIFRDVEFNTKATKKPLMKIFEGIDFIKRTNIQEPTVKSILSKIHPEQIPKSTSLVNDYSIDQTSSITSFEGTDSSNSDQITSLSSSSKPLSEPILEKCRIGAQFNKFSSMLLSDKRGMSSKVINMEESAELSVESEDKVLSNQILIDPSSTLKSISILQSPNQQNSHQKSSHSINLKETNVSLFIINDEC